MRIGIGYDVHKLVEGADLILGGCKIEYNFGLKGHSDADVLIHAIIDALLGAASLGDIGELFPPDENEYKNISSLILLKYVVELLKQNKFEVVNIDSVIIAEKPKLKNYKNQMITKLAESMLIKNDQINVKATTTEKLGFAGKELGIAAQAVVLIDSI
ncbi:MAG: 2-C-methyl-D-erythritol 2,4-cyclodiphosphate synthase [Bacillota bacterium]